MRFCYLGILTLQTTSNKHLSIVQCTQIYKLTISLFNPFEHHYLVGQMQKYFERE